MGHINDIIFKYVTTYNKNPFKQTDNTNDEFEIQASDYSNNEHSDQNDKKHSYAGWK